MTEAEFLAINWPEEFVVEYGDGMRETLYRGEGVSFTPSDDDPNGLGGICADLPKKSPHSRKTIGRFCQFDSLCRIEDKIGNLIWQRDLPRDG